MSEPNWAMIKKLEDQLTAAQAEVKSADDLTRAAIERADNLQAENERLRKVSLQLVGEEELYQRVEAEGNECSLHGSLHINSDGLCDICLEGCK